MEQVALKTTICIIVQHACRTRAYCPTMISSFKFSLGTVCLTFCRFNQYSNASNRNPQIVDFSLYI